LSNIGKYAITVSLGLNPNYDVTFTMNTDIDKALPQ